MEKTCTPLVRGRSAREGVLYSSSAPSVGVGGKERGESGRERHPAITRSPGQGEALVRRMDAWRGEMQLKTEGQCF